MDQVKILDLLLPQLRLDSATVKFIRELFHVILSSCSSLFRSTDLQRNATNRDIEDTAAKLEKVIAFFKSNDEERDEFIDIFPEWEDSRKENIKKLREIAESMRDSRQIASVAQIVGGSFGVVGGITIIGSILFPPAAPALLPAWLGGATALIPSFLLPAAATAVTSSLAVGGTIAAGAGGVAQVVTSVTEATLLSRQIDEAKDICLQDREKYNTMMGWFERTEKLKDALDSLFKVNVFEIIFRDLKDYFGQCNLSSMAFRLALQKCVGKTVGCGLFNPCLHMAVTAVTFAVFLIQRRNRFLFQWIKVGFGLVAALNAGPQFGRLAASTVMKDAHLIPKAVASKVAIGVLAGIGIALDITNIVLNSIDLAEGSKSEVQENVLEVADELQKNLDLIRRVHQDFLNAAKKASEDFLDMVIVDLRGMNATVIRRAHEVYQDVLKETRKLRKSVRPISGRAESYRKLSPRNIQIVIDYFNEADKERAFFGNCFSQWENKRRKNIASLHLITETLKEIRKLRSAAQYVGASEGAPAIGEGLSQRSQRIVGKVVVACQTLTNYSPAISLVAQLRKQTEEAIRICREDRDAFIKMEGWFLRMHKLNFAFDELFGKEVFDSIFTNLAVLCGVGLDYKVWNRNQEALKKCVRKIFAYPHGMDQAFHEAAIAIVVAVLMDGRRSQSHLFSFDRTRRSKDRREREWTSEFTKYTDEEETVLQSLEFEIGSVEGRVILLDAINVVSKLGFNNEVEIRGLAENLQIELNCMTWAKGQMPAI